jgi:hypothetical protein
MSVVTRDMTLANTASCGSITTLPGNRVTAAKRLAPIGLMPPAAFAVHQLRFWLAFHGGAGLELERQGHSYLHSLVPWLVTLLALALGAFLVSVGRALAGQRTVARYAISFAGLWAICALSLVAMSLIQECLEGVFAIGHPAGLVGIFGHGGWWVIPASACVGLVLAAIFHGARWVLDEVSDRRTRGSTAAVRRILHVRIPGDAVLPRLAPLAEGWSGRGPPR